MRDRRRTAEEVSELQQERIRKTVQAYMQEDTDFTDVDLSAGPDLYDPLRDGTVQWSAQEAPPLPPQETPAPAPPRPAWPARA